MYCGPKVTVMEIVFAIQDGVWWRGEQQRIQEIAEVKWM